MSNPWYTPSTAQEALVALEDVSFLNAFLADAFSQNAEIKLSDNGAAGLCLLHLLMERCARQSVKLLAKEVYRAKR